MTKHCDEFKGYSKYVEEKKEKENIDSRKQDGEILAQAVRAELSGVCEAFTQRMEVETVKPPPPPVA